jgi:protein involved in polysaccharide export with SLBB domain
MKHDQHCVSHEPSRTAVCVFISAVLLVGCESNISYPPPSETTDEARSDLSLAAGDTVEVKFYYTPELNEVQTVRPDGKIALQLVGEVPAEGLSPAALRSKLLQLYEPHLEKPEITVLVRSFYNRHIFVSGQVMRPGIIEMPGRMTVLDAIVQAGGFDMRQAEPRSVVVIRHAQEQRYGYAINLSPALDGDQSAPFYLKPQDIVYVPRTQIVKVGQWIDQHINRIIPQTGFVIRRVRGDTIVGIGQQY